MYDDLSMEHKIYKRSTSVDLSKGIVVCPLLSFYFLFLFFLLFHFCVASLALSIYLSFVLLGSFVLSSLGSFCLSTLGSFSHFRGNTLYFTGSIEDLSHFTKVLNIKKIRNYHDVCKCMPLPV